MILQLFGQLFSISRNTFTESIRQPVYVVLLFITTIALILNPNLAAYTFDDDNKLLIDLGLSSLFLSGLFLAAFTATGVLSSEIDNKTVLTVISKPIARPVFVLGKFLGVAGAIGVGYWTMTIVFLLTVRHGVQQRASQTHDVPVLLFGILAFVIALVGATAANYFYRWVFTSTFVIALTVLATAAWGLVSIVSPAGNIQSPATDWNPQLMIGIVMVFEAVLILTAVAIAASTRLGQIMTLVICVGAFGVGLVSEYFLGGLTSEYPWFFPLYVITPNLQLLWPADALTQGHDFTGEFFALISAYTFCIVGALLSLAVCLFQTRDVG